MKSIRLLAFLLFGLLCASSGAGAAARFAVCTTACTWDNSSTAMWSATSGGATGQSAPAAADTVTFDGATCVGGTTCTITVNANLSVTSITFGACTASTTGCILDFSVNNNNVSAATFSITGTGTRNLKMGSGTFTLTSVGNSNPWDASVTTNLTFSAGTSTILFSAAANGARTFATGGLTYSTVSVTDSGNGRSAFQMTGTAPTVGTFNITAPLRLVGTSNGSMTITNAFTWSGTYPGSMLLLESNPGANNTQFTINVASGNVSISGAFLRGLAFAGGATFAASNSIDGGGNSGITITNPPTGAGRCIGC